MQLLDKINTPEDVKKLNNQELTCLAKELREFILNTVSRTGGHLAPSLGVVELTLAIHYVFDTSKDRLTWDVGHQSYVHKILTGRKDKFHSLRQFGGLSGFPKREESLYDAFNTGHSSTSISASLGFALAREQLGEEFTSIAVIGDGALTGGQAFEALNQAGHLGINLLVILNDNEMSIDQNVGAMSSYLSRLRADPFYTKRKKDLEQLLKKVPAIGPSVLKAGERVKDSLKYLLVPGMLFEELGFTYLGPIDGHNIPQLVSVLKSTKSLQGPILLHVLTKKGKGYGPAVDNPATFHGIGPFCLQSGGILKKPGPQTPTYTSVFSDTLLELAAKDEKIIAITAAMPEGTGLSVFAQKYPQRYIDVGIAEQNAVTLAAAMALKGLKPVVAIYSTFLQRAYDQIVHDVCLQKAPVLFAVDRAGIVGEDGPTHHGAFDFSYLRHIPEMSVMAPKDEEELRHMLFTAFDHHEGPVAIRYPRGQGLGTQRTTLQKLPWGSGEIMALGNDLLIIAIGSMVYPALAVKDILKNYGYNTTVINARFVKPLDENLILDAVQKHPYLVTMEENVLQGGFGSAVLELLAKHQMPLQNILNIGMPDKFATHGNLELVKDEIGLSPEKMTKRIIEYFNLEQKKPKLTLSFIHKRNNKDDCETGL